MRLGSIIDFLNARLMRPRDEPPQAAQDAVRTQKANAALQLINSDIFVEAYQDELAGLVDELLQLDMANSEHREKALNLLARTQALQQLVRHLGGYIASEELSKAKPDARAA